MKVIKYVAVTLLLFNQHYVLGNEQLNLIYSSDFIGEIKPCGCSEKGNLGGILRRATKLDELRRLPNPILVSAGDILYYDENTASNKDKQNTLTVQQEQNNIKSHYILKAYEQYRLNAILPGEEDLQYGLDMLSQYSLPWLLSNQEQTDMLKKIISLTSPGNKKIYILGVIEPALTKKIMKLSEPAVALNILSKQYNIKKEDFVILLTHGSEKFSNNLSRLPYIDIIVRGHIRNKSPTSIPKKHRAAHHNAKNLTTSKKTLSAGYRGQYIGHASLNIYKDNLVLNNTITPLPSTIPDQPKLSRLYKQYDNAITQWWTKKSLTKINQSIHENPFANKSCKLCHTQIFKQWISSKHSNAIGSLKQVKKHNDPDCLFCHSTGMHQPGGFISLEHTPKLANVQCEACHTAAKKHAHSPIKVELPNAFESCSTCHTKEHSPGFALIDYWKKIKHTIEGKTAIHKQALSPVYGQYTIIDKRQPAFTRNPLELTEFFSFYCSRCYVFNSEIKKTKLLKNTNIKIRSVPIVFGEQKNYAAIAYLVAKNNGLEDKVKKALFSARFENNIDISNKTEILKIMTRYNLVRQTEKALNNPQSKENILFKHYRTLKKKNAIYSTPTIIINNNLKVLPEHTANNTNLMVENVSDILNDMLCRKTGQCN